MAVLTSAHVAERGGVAALVDEFREVSWSELDERVNRLVNGLRDAGLSTGDTVAVIVGNHCEYFELAMACAHGGWTYVPVNWHWVADELAYVFADAAAVAVFVDDRFAEATALALRDERSAGVSSVVGIRTGADSPLRSDPRFVEFESVVRTGSPDEPTDQMLGGPMFYTSGTTGRPKGVRGMLSGGSQMTPDIMKLVAAGFSNFLPIPGRTMLCGPFYHSAQWAFSYLPMIGGSSVVMQHKFDSAGMLELIDRYGCTNVHLVPTQMKRMLDLPDEVKRRFDGSSLTTVWHGAAPCPPAVKRGLIEWLGPKVTEYYGSTEGSIISTISATDWVAKGGSVGKPLETVEVIVVDDAGQRVAPGAEGTLYFRNKMGTDFTYHNDEGKTAAAHLEPGVFTTGDVGYLDADGYLWLSDRKIDMIISGGVNIYPAEIEGVLAVHPAVEDVAVIGVPDEEFGESVKALVQLKDGIMVDESLSSELIAHCRGLLAGYKAPRSVDFVDGIPRTGTGKIQKAPLRAPYWEGHQRRI
ncbi:MAG: AMP-binding protein [Acidimicrobiia bacterium]